MAVNNPTSKVGLILHLSDAKPIPIRPSAEYNPRVESAPEA